MYYFTRTEKKAIADAWKIVDESGIKPKPYQIKGDYNEDLNKLSSMLFDGNGDFYQFGVGDYICEFDVCSIEDGIKSIRIIENDSYYPFQAEILLDYHKKTIVMQYSLANNRFPFNAASVDIYLSLMDSFLYPFLTNDCFVGWTYIDECVMFIQTYISQWIIGFDDDLKEEMKTRGVAKESLINVLLTIEAREKKIEKMFNR